MRVPTLTDMPVRALADSHWRAALIVLCGAFGRDGEVWQHVQPGVHLDLAGLAVDPRRSPAERLLLTVAASLCQPDSGHQVNPGALVELSDRSLRLVLDALAVARGRALPVD